MSALSDLISAGLIEKDSNNDLLWTWAFPSVAAEMRQILLQKCGLQNSSSQKHSAAFCYCHHQQSWFYLHRTETFDLDKLPRVKQFTLVLQTRDFHPGKYEVLSRAMSKAYCKTGSASAMLQLYLSVWVKGSWSTKESGSFCIQDFDVKTSLARVPVKDVIKMFGLEIILIYTAVILKKRIVAYHHHLDSLLSFLRVIPTFVWHRQNWNDLYPYMQLTKSEISELLGLKTYIAGFIDASVEGKTELYDLFVNFAATEITVAPHAKEIFAMTKTHKDIAVFITRQAENSGASDEHIIKEIAVKTRELLDSLRSLCSRNVGGSISLSALKENKFAPALENFLWNLAVAEELVEI